MNPSQYEELVADHFRSKGYIVSKTPQSNDYGVDVIAAKGEEKLAVQAKMYGGTNRKVNRAAVMELVGAMKFAKCNKAVIATDGEVLPDAEAVASELDVSIIRLTVASTDFVDTKPDNNALNTGVNNSGSGTDFDTIWRESIMPLAGQTILTATGQPNKIVTVDWGGIERITSKGNRSMIPIEPFRFAVMRLLSSGKVTRDEINQEFAKERCSSGVFAILSQVPLFAVASGKPAALILCPDKR